MKEENNSIGTTLLRAVAAITAIGFLLGVGILIGRGMNPTNPYASPSRGQSSTDSADSSSSGANADSAQQGTIGSAAMEKAEEILALIDNYFVGEIDETKMADAVAEGLIAGTGDRWSYYISADEYDAYMEDMNNAYVGIGITIQLQEEDDPGFTITDVTPDSPAFQAGVEIGDMLIAVEGESVVELGMDEAKNRVRGEEGTDVRLTFSRENVPYDVTITRASIAVQNVRASLLDNAIGYILIGNFDANCAQDTIAAIEALQQQGAEKFVFDVRFNPGGYKHELVALLDYLLPEGDLFISESYDGQIEVDTSDAACVDFDMVVLVNGDSYSAAEFFAAALREYDAAKVVGEQTCGKGYFQTTIPLSDGSAVALSVGKYRTPKGVSLAEAGGLTPDVELELSDEDYSALYFHQLSHEEDEQLQAAIALLLQTP